LNVRFNADSIHSALTIFNNLAAPRSTKNTSVSLLILDPLLNLIRRLAACENVLADHRILVKPACGARLAFTHERALELAGFETMLIVVCDGVITTVDQLPEWKEECRWSPLNPCSA
jgi:hypothetical protein